MKNQTKRQRKPVTGLRGFQRRVAQAIYAAECEVRETVRTVKARDPAAKSTAQIL